MIKSLLFAIFLFCSGCIVVASVSNSSSSSSYDELWFVSPRAECNYDNYWGDSTWHLSGDLESTYWYTEEEVEVWLFLDGPDEYRMSSAVYGTWHISLQTYYYDCHDATTFTFWAFDVYGNEAETVLFW